MRRLLAGALAMGTAALLPENATACTSSVCQMANRQEADAPRRGRLRIDLSYRYADNATRRAGSASTQQVVRPYVDLERGLLFDGWHDDYRAQESLLLAEATFGLSDSTTIHATFPLQADRRMEGGDETCENPYGARGLGDLTLGVRHARRVAGGTLSGTVAVKVPTGPSHKKSAGAFLDPTVQPGSGSTDLVGAASWTVRGLGTAWTATASRQFAGRSDLDFAFGDESILAVAAARPVSRRVQAFLQAKLVFRERSVLADTAVPSSGSRVVYVTPGLRIALPGGVSAYALVPVPLASHVNETQLAPTRGLVLGMTRMF